MTKQELHATTRDRESVLEPLRAKLPTFNLTQQNRNLTEKGVFQFKGTSQRANHFKISHVSSVWHFQNPETMHLTITHQSEDTGGTVTPHDVEEQYIPVDKTHHMQVVDYFQRKDMAEFSNYNIADNPNSETFDLNLPFDVPDGNHNTSHMVVHASPTTKAFGLTQDEDTDLMYEQGTTVNVVRQPARNISLFYNTGDTTDPEWHIGDFSTEENPHYHIFTQETIRQGIHPLTKTKNLEIHARDTYTGLPIYKSQLGDGTKINLHTQMAFL